MLVGDQVVLNDSVKGVSTMSRFFDDEGESAIGTVERVQGNGRIRVNFAGIGSHKCEGSWLKRTSKR